MPARVRNGRRRWTVNHMTSVRAASSFLERAADVTCRPGVPASSKGGGTDTINKCASTRTVIFHRLGRTGHAGPFAEAQDAVHGPLASRPAVVEVSRQGLRAVARRSKCTCLGAGQTPRQT